jgi:hypothetical protein
VDGLVRHVSQPGVKSEKALPGMLADTQEQINAVEENAGEPVLPAPYLDAEEDKRNPICSRPEKGQQLQKTDVPNQNQLRLPLSADRYEHRAGLRMRNDGVGTDMHIAPSRRRVIAEELGTPMLLFNRPPEPLPSQSRAELRASSASKPGEQA